MLKLVLLTSAFCLADVFAPEAVIARSGQLTLEPCTIPGFDKQARCGTFRVPENLNDPTSKTLPLRVVILPAKSSQPAREPVFYFEGGPGQQATESARYMANAWFRANNDVVLIDQRGTGPGHRLDCELPGSDSDVSGYAEQPYAAFARCGSELAKIHDLTQYTTPNFIRDVDEVRRALGYDKVNLYGASYGSRAVIAFARLLPQQVRSLYLSGVVPFELRMPLYFPWSVQRAIDATLATCATDRACRTKYPDPGADLKAANDRLSKSPARVRIKNPATGKLEDVTLTQWGFASAVLAKLYTSGSPSDLPETLSRARNGDYTELASDWIKSNSESRNSFAWGLNRAINCMEDVSRIRPGEIEKEAAGTFFGPTLGLATVELCKAWPRAAYPKGFFDPFTLNVPVMITSGEYDPVTPPRWGEIARKYFPNSFHLVTLQGHSNFREEGCLGEIASEFLRRGAAKGLDFTCANERGSGLQLIK